MAAAGSTRLFRETDGTEKGEADNLTGGEHIIYRRTDMLG